MTALYRPLLYSGSTVSCPCCGRAFRRFVTHRGRRNVRCPVCGAMERHRLLWLWLDRQEWLRPGLRILHVAPEPALAGRLRDTAEGRYVGADLDSPLGQRMDLMHLPLDDGTFDLVVCNHVLEHVPDDHRALAEIARVLDTDGRAILMAPIGRDTPTTVEAPDAASPSERLEHFGQEDHVRLYGADYGDRVRSAGLDLEEHDLLARLDERTVAMHALAQRHPRFADDVIQLARKR